jgi:very-short-patch-repair endonuclease
MRNEMPESERRLWQYLRRRSIAGLRFRRQVPIGRFIADFACISARLIIEIDGDQHALEIQKARDAKRTQALEGAGWRVVRFWSSELFEDMERVVERIRELVDADHVSSPIAR